MGDGAIAAVRSWRGVNVPLMSGGHGSLGNGKSFSHPAPKGRGGGTGLRDSWKVLRKHVGHIADEQPFAHVCEVAVQFDVVRGRFTNLACTHADDAIVWV